VYDTTDTVRLVADAKWKTKAPSNADFYQLSTYMLAKDVSGLLVYTDCDGHTASKSEVAGQSPLTLVELPTAADVDSYESFIEALEAAVRTQVVVEE
jgi:5-methylcytosine-specific restriction enzyme subunit McrC